MISARATGALLSWQAGHGHPIVSYMDLLNRISVAADVRFGSKNSTARRGLAGAQGPNHTVVCGAPLQDHAICGDQRHALMPCRRDNDTIERIPRCIIAR